MWLLVIIEFIHINNKTFNIYQTCIQELKQRILRKLLILPKAATKNTKLGQVRKFHEGEGKYYQGIGQLLRFM